MYYISHRESTKGTLQVDKKKKERKWRTHCVIEKNASLTFLNINTIIRRCQTNDRRQLRRHC